MHPRQKKKFIIIITLLIILALATALVLYALKQNINLFYTPTQLLHTQLKPQQVIRIGGYVKNKSVQFDSSGKAVTFMITDRQHEITVQFQGILPNLFREGQAVVVTGKLHNAQTLQAQQVLAKHDEKYIPFKK